MRTTFFLILGIIFLVACGKIQDKIGPEGEKIEIEVKYAEGFRLWKVEKGYHLEVLRTFPGSTSSLHYLISEQSPRSELIKWIKTPINRIVCTSTTQLPMLNYLDEEHRIVGFPTTDYISTLSVRERVDKGEITELGNVLDMNMEKLLEISPDLIINYSMDNLKKTERLESRGFTVLIDADYLENHPLGRAEWIKVFGALTGKVEEADSIFRYIEREYLSIKEFAVGSSGPCCFSGSLYGDSWFMPGGKNYAARLLTDAGFSYSLSSDTSYGFLQWGYENVYQQSYDCEYWIGPAPFRNLEMLGKADERYKNFVSFKEGNVFVYDNNMGPTGGNQYLELGYLRPDIILKDLMKIRNPESLPEHELYFYRKLE